MDLDLDKIRALDRATLQTVRAMIQRQKAWFAEHRDHPTYGEFCDGAICGLDALDNALDQVLTVQEAQRRGGN